MTIKQQILDVIKADGGWVTSHQIKARIPDINRGCVSRVLSGLYAEAKVDRKGAGVRGDPHWYCLPSVEGQENQAREMFKDWPRWAPALSLEHNTSSDDVMRVSQIHSIGLLGRRPGSDQANHQS